MPSKGKKASNAVKAGRHQHQKRKVRTSVHFKRPGTLQKARSPKCPKKSVPSRARLDKFRSGVGESRLELKNTENFDFFDFSP